MVRGLAAPREEVSLARHPAQAQSPRPSQAHSARQGGRPSLRTLLALPKGHCASRAGALPGSRLPEAPLGQQNKRPLLPCVNPASDFPLELGDGTKGPTGLKDKETEILGWKLTVGRSAGHPELSPSTFTLCPFHPRGEVSPVAKEDAGAHMSLPVACPQCPGRPALCAYCWTFSNSP